MTCADRVLEAVAKAVIDCPQLRMTVVTCPHCGGPVTAKATLGQRINAAKQIRKAVAAAISGQLPSTPNEQQETVGQ